MREKIQKNKKICIVSVIIAAMLLSVGFSGCAQEKADEKAIAATVGDKVIYESEITNDIDYERSVRHLENNADFAQWLVNSILTPESYREKRIYSYASQNFALPLYAQNLGCYIDDEDKIERIISKEAYLMMKNHDDTDYASALEHDNVTDKIFRQNIINTISTNGLLDYYENSGTMKKMPDEYFLSSINDIVPSGETVYLATFSLGLTEQEALDTLNDENNTSNAFVYVRPEDLKENIPTDPVERNREHILCMQQMDLTTPGETKVMKFQMGGWDNKSGEFNSYERYIALRYEGQLTVPAGGITATEQVPSVMLEYIKKGHLEDFYVQTLNDDATNFIDEMEIKINPMPEWVSYNVSLDGVKYAPELTDDEAIYDNNKFQL